MTVRAWMAAWEVECCGAPFRIGDAVEWALLPPASRTTAFVRGQLGESVEADDVRSALRHGRRVMDVPKTSGVVTGINAVLCRFERAEGTGEWIPKPRTGRLQPIEASDDEVFPGDGETFTAYLVDLDVTEIR
ncbi:hypothetical protein REH65_26715 [Saccharopolyspora sp. ID03-671]|uniref:DUF6578 domain-containing protein n=1 Tax=Saccharopolyspora sp. ID03-671 TaxID=3073066 RepID=UPI00324834E7